MAKSIVEEIEIFHNRMFSSNQQIQTSMVKLLELFSLKYWNDPAVTIPGVALSCILTSEQPNDLKKINSLKYTVNQAKMYQQYPTLFKACIDIESLDITLIHELLTKVKKFPTHKAHLRALKQQLNHCNVYAAPNLLCCQKCSHTCLTCGKEECDQTCPNLGCDHSCKYCNVKKSQCMEANCVQCQQKPPEEQCGFLIVCVDSLELFHKNRNNISHMTSEDCKQFIEKRKTLSGFSQCCTPENIFQSILSSYKRIVDLLTNQKLFHFNGATPISFLNRRKLLNQMNSIFFNNEINVSQEFAQSIAKQSFFVTEENKTLREKNEALEKKHLYSENKFCLEEYHEDGCVLSVDIEVVDVVEIRVFQYHNEQKIEVEVHDHQFQHDTAENISVVTVKHTIKSGCKYKYEAVVEDADNTKWMCCKDGLDPFDINYVELKNITTNNKLIKVACNERNIDNQILITEKISFGFKASFNAIQNDSIVAIEYKKHRSLSFEKLDVQTTCQRKEKNYLLECLLPSSGIYNFRVLIRSRSHIYRFLTLNDIEIFDHLEHTSSCCQTMLMFHPYGECNDVHQELKVLPRQKSNSKNGLLVTIKPSAGGVAIRDIDDLDNYVEQNFRNQNFFSFPPLYVMSRDTSYYQIVERFESYYRKREDSKAIILSGADFRDNLLTLGYEDEDIAKLCNDTLRTESVFVFDSKQNTVFVINICKEKEVNAETLKDHHRQCNNVASLFLTINQHIIGKHPMAIVGIVACLNTNREDVKRMADCEDCFQQVLTNDDLQSTKSFSGWFDELNFKVKKCSNSHLEKSESNDFVFKDIPNRLLLLSAIKNFSLPATSVGTEEEKLSRLVLNYPQIHAVYDEKSSKKVIKGGYGSGKTLILKKALEILLTDGIPTRVYYILFDPYSMVNMEIVKYVSTKLKIPKSTLEKVSLKNVYQLSHQAKARKLFTLAECFEHIKKHHPNETTHVLVDEYDEEELTQIQALQIKHLMSSENFKDATVVISVQSVEKHSTKFDENQLPIENNTVLDWETAGMKLYNLSHTMRSTTNISDLVETFQEGVAKKKNLIHLPVIEEPSKRKGGFLDSKLRRLFSPRKHNVQSNQSSIGASVPTISRSEQSNDSANKFSVPDTSTGDITEPDSSTNSNMLQAEASIDTLAATSSVISTHHSSRIQRSFKFIPSKPGHKIIGTRPKLLRLENSSYIDISIVQYYIQNYCFKGDHQNKALFICNKISLLQSFIEVFKCLGLEIFEYCDSILNNQPPSFEKQKNAYDKLMNAEEKNLLVLTDIRGCRGLEYRKVICVVDERNQYERHMLVEGLSRATSQLYILSIQDESNENNISKIIDNLVEKKYVDNVTRHCKDGIADIKERETVKIKVDIKQDKSDIMKRKYEVMTTRSVLEEEDINRNWSFEDLNVLIKDRNFTKVIQLIKILPSRIYLSGDVYGYGGNNNNLLHSASVYDSDVDFVQHLINAGCSLKEKNSHGLMPIHWAAWNNRVGIVKVILDNDPSLINERNDRVNSTSLHYAALYNCKEVVRFLLNRPNIDVNIRNVYVMMADEFNRTNDEIKRMIRKHRENNSL